MHDAIHPVDRPGNGLLIGGDRSNASVEKPRQLLGCPRIVGNDRDSGAHADRDLCRVGPDRAATKNQEVGRRRVIDRAKQNPAPAVECCRRFAATWGAIRPATFDIGASSDSFPAESVTVS